MRGMRGSDEPVRKIPFKDQLPMLKSFARYYPLHKKLLVLDLVAVLLMPVISTATPLIIYRSLDVYLPDKNASMLILCMIALLFLTLFSIVCEYICARWGHTLGVRMEADMRDDLFRHIQKLSFTYFDKTKTGHIMSRISNDLTMIAEVAHHCPEDILSSLLMFLGGVAVMLYINPILTLFVALPLPLVVYWACVFQPRMRSKFRTVRKEVAEINSQVENSIQGVREVKSYTNEKREIDRFKTVNSNFRVARENVFSLMAAFHAGMTFFFQGYTVLFLGIGVYLIFLGKADAAQLITFYMFSGRITMPVMRLVGFVEQYQQGMAAFERFHEIMLEQPEIQDKPNALARLETPLSGAISVAHLTFKYSDMTEAEPNVLSDISLEIPPGATLALVGESGAGKTTFASLIPRFYEASSGSICLDGTDIRDFKQKLLRSQIGIVQQSPFLFDTTIRENILFGKPDASEDELIQAAKNANIHDFIASLPNGFDSLCGENGVRLSGGQKQRVSIARVFLKNPPILIFDEATSALDNESEALVQESMARLCSNRTTIIIAHRLSTVKNASLICCMKNGIIVEQGTHAELIAQDGYYKHLYSMHSF